jgi:hypothetical protein
VLELELDALPHPATTTADVASAPTAAARNFAFVRLAIIALQFSSFAPAGSAVN